MLCRRRRRRRCCCFAAAGLLLLLLLLCCCAAVGWCCGRTMRALSGPAGECFVLSRMPIIDDLPPVPASPSSRQPAACCFGFALAPALRLQPKIEEVDSQIDPEAASKAALARLRKREKEEAARKERERAEEVPLPHTSHMKLSAPVDEEEEVLEELEVFKRRSAPELRGAAAVMETAAVAAATAEDARCRAEAKERVRVEELERPQTARAFEPAEDAAPHVDARVGFDDDGARTLSSGAKRRAFAVSARCALEERSSGESVVVETRGLDVSTHPFTGGAGPAGAAGALLCDWAPPRRAGRPCPLVF